MTVSAEQAAQECLPLQLGHLQHHCFQAAPISAALQQVRRVRRTEHPGDLGQAIPFGGYSCLLNGIPVTSASISAIRCGLAWVSFILIIEPVPVRQCTGAVSAPARRYALAVW